MFRIKSLVARMCARPVTASRPKANAFRPALEQVESREVPANLLWTGGGTNNAYSNPLNWTVTAGGPVGSHQRPVPGDNLYYGGTGGSNKDCGSFGSDGYYSYYTSQNSVHVLSGYTGNLSMPTPMSIGVFEMKSAATVDMYTDLTVTNTLDWTAGTIGRNVGSNVNLRLSGAVADIQPANGGEVKTNANIVAENAAHVKVLNGSIVSALDTAIYVKGASRWTAAAARLVGPTPSQKPVSVTDGSEIVLTGTFSTRGLYLKNSTAKILGQGKTTTFNSRVPGFLGAEYAVNVDHGANIGQTTWLVIENGATLDTAGDKVFIWNGNLATQAAPNLATQPPAVINGELQTTGRGTRIDISFSMFNPNLPSGQPDPKHYFGRLKIEGKVVWDGGAYNPHCDPANNGVSDVWECTEFFEVNGSETCIEPQQNLPKDNRNVYSIMVAGKGIVPSFAAPDKFLLPKLSTAQNTGWAYAPGTLFSDPETPAQTTWQITWTK